MKKYRLLPSTCSGVLALVLVCVALGPVTRAHADFSGPYVLGDPGLAQNNPAGQFGNWTSSGTDREFPELRINTLQAPASLKLETGEPVSSYQSDFASIVFTTTATAAGPFSFAYELTLENTYNDRAAYSVNGVLTQLAAGTNTISNVSLAAGDVFGFVVEAGFKSIQSQIPSGTSLTVTNFSAPVPEPSIFGWLAVGLVGFGARRYLAIRR